MFDSSILDMVIGVTFIYFLLSLICSAIAELITRVLGLRARMLFTGIANLLDDPAINALLHNRRGELWELAGEQLETPKQAQHPNYLAALFYKHPLIDSMGKGSERPSYLSGANFATAFIDTIQRVSRLTSVPGLKRSDSGKEEPPSTSPDRALQKFRGALSMLPAGNLRSLLRSFLSDDTPDMAAASAAIARWYDSAMDRVSGWYKRLSDRIILSIAAVICCGLCVDTVQIVQKISRDSRLRGALADLAQGAQQDREPAPLGALAAANAVADLPGLPLGWGYLAQQEQRQSGHKSPLEWTRWFFLTLLGSLPGIGLTIFAISLGAPFWFDLLNKVVKVRAAGRRPERMAPEAPAAEPGSGRLATAGAQATAEKESAAVLAEPDAAGRMKITTVGNTDIFGAGTAIVLLSGMQVEARGAPSAYHPPTAASHAGMPPGLDAWYNAEEALIRDPAGTPVVQRSGDPAPGFFVSRTGLYTMGLPASDPRKYVDAQAVPYLVLPQAVLDHTHVDLGDLAMVFVRGENGFDPHAASYAIVADVRSDDAVGGGSIALARALDIYAGAVHIEHTEPNIVYVVFTGSRTKPAWPRKLDEMSATARYLFQKWGGMDRLVRECLELEPPALAYEEDETDADETDADETGD